MKGLVAVDQFGRMVLPKSIRTKLKLDEGGLLRVRLVGRHVELTPVQQGRRKLKSVGPFLVAESDGNRYDAVADIAAMRRKRLA